MKRLNERFEDGTGAAGTVSAPMIEVAAATGPRHSERVLVIDPQSRRFAERSVHDLSTMWPGGALIVVNDAGTGAASLLLRTDAGEGVEARFYDLAAGCAVVLGAGAPRLPTEQRGAPPAFAAGETLRTAAGAAVRVVSRRGRRVHLSTGDDTARALRALLAREGKTVGYAYLDGDATLNDVQSPIAGAPVSAEMPSASRLLNTERILQWRRAGCEVVALTHAAGLSSVDGGRIDATLPWAERFTLPMTSGDAVARARREGRKVIALGTTVARALEGAARGDRDCTNVVLGRHHALEWVDGIVTGVHDVDSSHHALLGAFCAPELLVAANRFAAERGFLGHEFGDFTLVLNGALDA